MLVTETNERVHTAQYSGRCSRMCGRSIVPGDKIIGVAGRWRHVGCEPLLKHQACTTDNLQWLLELYRDTGMFDGTVLSIKMRAGFELGGAYETWGKSWEVRANVIPSLPFAEGWGKTLEEACGRLMQQLEELCPTRSFPWQEDMEEEEGGTE